MNFHLDHIQNIRIDNPQPSASIELANLLFFDLETTGLRPDRGAKITEATILNRNSQVYSWQSYVNPGTSSFSDELPIILNQLKKGVVIGHNLPFDFWFISYEADKLGIDGPNLRFIDTLSFARKVLPDRSNYKLSTLLTHFNIKVNGELHTATTDTEVTRALFWKLIEKGGISTVGEAGMKKLNWSNY
jgi:DNA polymerase III subunit epsilon